MLGSQIWPIFLAWKRGGGETLCAETKLWLTADHKWYCSGMLLHDKNRVNDDCNSVGMMCNLSEEPRSDLVGRSQFDDLSHPNQMPEPFFFFFFGCGFITQCFSRECLNDTIFCILFTFGSWLLCITWKPWRLCMLSCRFFEPGPLLTFSKGCWPKYQNRSTLLFPWSYLSLLYFPGPLSLPLVSPCCYRTGFWPLLMSISRHSARSTLNMDRHSDNDGLPLAITVADAVGANGVPPWNWRDAGGLGEDPSPFWKLPQLDLFHGCSSWGHLFLSVFVETRAADGLGRRLSSLGASGHFFFWIFLGV